MVAAGFAAKSILNVTALRAKSIAPSASEGVPKEAGATQPEPWTSSNPAGPVSGLLPTMAEAAAEASSASAMADGEPGRGTDEPGGRGRPYLS